MGGTRVRREPKVEPKVPALLLLWECPWKFCLDASYSWLKVLLFKSVCKQIVLFIEDF